MSAQEATEEVDADELRRIAKEADEKAKDEKDGEEIRNQPKPHKEYSKSSRAFQDDDGERGEHEPEAGPFGSSVAETKRRARCVDPLVEATSGHMAVIRLHRKNISNMHRYWGPDNETGNKEAVDQWKEDWLEVKRSHVPKGLPVDEHFRPVDSTLDQWRTIWKETRDGYNPNDLTIEEYVEMKGVPHLMGLFCLELYPILLEMFGKDKLMI